MPRHGTSGSNNPSASREKSSNKENDRPGNGFAPAFRRMSKKRNDYDEVEDNPYEYMKSRDYSTASAWNTWDRTTGKKNYSNAYHPEDVGPEPIGVWNQWGIKTTPKDSTQGVDHLFVGTDEVMQQSELPRNAFEAANKSALGLGSRSSTIVNMIGNEAIGSVSRRQDDRLQYLDERGNYRDGQNRGQTPKRLLDEYKFRVRQRREEMMHAIAVLNEWDSLSTEQREQRRQDGCRNMGKMDKRGLNSGVESDIPEKYGCDKTARDSFATIDLEDDPLYVDDSECEEPLAAGAIDSPPASHRHLPFRIKQAQNSKIRSKGYASGFGSRRDSSDSSYKALTAKARTPAHHQLFPSGTEKRSRGAFRREMKLASRRSSSQRGKGCGSNDYQPLPPPAPQSTVKSSVSESSLFLVIGFPKIMPPEDIDTVTENLKDLNLNVPNYLKTAQQSITRGRLVTVQLHRNLRFSFEAVISRVFGGQVQEFQQVPC